MPKKLYIDQCSLSTMCADPATLWRKTKLGGTIAGLVNDGTVEVWTSPVNVLEIFLCADFDKQNRVLDTAKLDLRVRLAQALVELSDCRRMRQVSSFSSCGFSWKYLPLKLRQLSVAQISLSLP